MKNWSIPLLLLNLGFFLGCDRVKETPEPDSFGAIQFKETQVQAPGGSAEIDLMKMFNITQQVDISFSQPKNGSLTPNPSRTKFTYKAHSGFENWDTLNFRVCRQPDCKPGMLRIWVSNNPIPECFPEYSSLDEWSWIVPAQIGKSTFKLPLFPGDKYCPLNYRRFDYWTNNLLEPFFQQDSIVVRLNEFPVTRKIVSQIKFSNVDSSHSSVVVKNRTFNITIDTNRTYCKQLFQVKDWDGIQTLGQSWTITRNTFLRRGLVQRCEGDLHPVRWDVIVSKHLTVFHSHDDGGKVIRKKRNSDATLPGEKFVKFIFYNRDTTVRDTGKVIIEY
jgi:hypothetical protein